MFVVVAEMVPLTLYFADFVDVVSFVVVVVAEVYLSSSSLFFDRDSPKKTRSSC